MCDCEAIICLNVVPALCADEITLRLAANETGTWLVFYEFNSRWFGLEVEVIDGQNIVLPYVFNNNYTHNIKFYNTDYELFNDTCYSLNTSTIPSAGVAPSPSPDLGYLLVEISGNITTVDAADDTYYNAWFLTHDITEITTNGQSYLVGESFTQSNGFITWTNGGSWYVTQIVKFEE